MPFQIIRNNIVNVAADAIVNTANPYVGVGAGVDYAIYSAAGWDELLDARSAIGEMVPGEVAYTPAFGLNAKYIIHCIGPEWRGGGYGEREIVAQCYSKALNLAYELECESIAFPLLATGTYGFPKDEALRIAIREISSFLLDHEMDVILVVFDKEAFELSGKVFDAVSSFIDDSQAVRQPYSDFEAMQNISYSYAMRDSYDERPMPTCGPDEAGSGSRRRLFGWRKRRRAESGSKDIRDAGKDKGRESRREIGWEEELEKDRREAGKLEDTLECYDAEELAEALGADDAGAEYELAAGAIPEADFLPDMAYGAGTASDSIETRLKHMDKTFQQHLFMMIDRKGLTDPEVYKKANIDRKLFSKIRSDVNYKPSKRTAIALGMALELNIDEMRDLLMRAGIALSPSDVFDIIIRFCIENRMYDIYEINCVLFKYDQPLLGA